MVFSVDVFNEGLDVPTVATILMLRPTESPVVFLQQLGRGLRRTVEKTSLVVIDFIGNHRSFLLKPRVLLGVATGLRPSTTAVLDAMRSGDFALPAGCLTVFDVEAVEVLARLARIGPRSGLEDFCRSYAAEEEGRRPTAVQAWRAGHNPAAARSAHGGWFGLLDHLGLLDDQEVEVWRAHTDVLTGLEAEQITKSYKLVTLKALLHDRTLRTGAGMTELSWTSHRLVNADPRLIEDTRSDSAMPDPVGADEAVWRDYWRRWPLAAWVGELRNQPGRWFRIEGERFMPTFRVEEEHAATFDALVSEIVDWRLARYLFTRGTSARLRVGQTNGRPLLWLDRDRNPGLPTGESRFTADGEVYVGRFVKVALNLARRRGSTSNDLHALLQRWFGASAGQRGTDHYVDLVKIGSGWLLEPADNGAVPAESEEETA